MAPFHWPLPVAFMPLRIESPITGRVRSASTGFLVSILGLPVRVSMGCLRATITAHNALPQSATRIVTLPLGSVHRPEALLANEGPAATPAKRPTANARDRILMPIILPAPTPEAKLAGRIRLQ